VRSTVGLAHNLGLTIVAEGVEDPEAVRLLKELGCDLAQGYYFGAPEPAERLTAAMLRRGKIPA
jgi:EAL domain-containing protein (putative c-di-GMP-specific phosphodiesterase class I)